jgi:hypothetical protein
MEPQMNADERRYEKNADSSAFVRVHLRFLIIFAAIAGCATDKHPTTRPASVRDRQEAALADPFGYSPDMNSSETDISGGNVNELDRGALRKDLDHVLNP